MRGGQLGTLRALAAVACTAHRGGHPTAQNASPATQKIAAKAISTTVGEGEERGQR